jgi:hypothetical protein
MTSKKEQTATAVQKTKPKRLARAPSSHTASEKAQAVLALWTDRVKTRDVMKMLGVQYVTLQQWQERAMEGMLQALEPRVNLKDGAVLSPRLQALLDRRMQTVGAEKLAARLAQLVEVAPEGKPPVDP